MRTLLRQTDTGLFFQGPDQWTADPTKAHNFKLIDRALDFIAKWQLKNVELAFAFGRDKVTQVSSEKLGLNYAER